MSCLLPALAAAQPGDARERLGGGRARRRGLTDHAARAGLHRRDRDLLQGRRQARASRRAPSPTRRRWSRSTRATRRTARRRSSTRSRWTRPRRRPTRPTPTSSRPARSSRRCSPSSRTIPASRTTSSTATTIRRSRPGASPPRALREDRAGGAARAAHAVAHLHAARAVAGVGRVQPRLGRRGQGLLRAPRQGHGVGSDAARAGLPRLLATCRLGQDAAGPRVSSTKSRAMPKAEPDNFAAAYALRGDPGALRWSSAAGARRPRSPRAPAFPWDRFA